MRSSEIDVQEDGIINALDRYGTDPFRDGRAGVFWKKEGDKFAKLERISYLCIMKMETRENEYIRTVFKTREFDSFYMNLPEKVKDKFDYVINIITRLYNVSTKFIKHLENTDLYEMRVSIGTNEYRTILFAIDHENFIEAKNIIFLNGFLKKGNKDYRKQVEIAENILKRLEL